MPGTSDHPVRVVLFGFGTVGKAAGELCGRRPGLEVAGVVTRRGDAKASGAVAEQGAREVLARTRPHVVMHATTSLAVEVREQIEMCLNQGAAVVTSSEEMAYPASQHSEIAASISRAAKSNGRAVVGVGVNPGFVFDVLPVTLSAAAWGVEEIRCRRVLDASVFGRTVHRTLGLGYGREEFESAVARGEIRGHLGFTESAAMICRAMGRELDGIEEELLPVLARRNYSLRDWTLEKGTVAGVVHRAVARSEGHDWIHFDLSLHVSPEDERWAPVDEVRIEGEDDLRLTIDPGTDAVRTTAARLVNSIPTVLSASPGLHAATELPPAAPWFGAEMGPRSS